MKAKRMSLAATMALALSMAVWAPAASASSYQFEVDGSPTDYPTEIWGSNRAPEPWLDSLGEHVFSVRNGVVAITCRTVDVGGDTMDGPRPFLVFGDASYEDCSGAQNGTSFYKVAVLAKCSAYSPALKVPGISMGTPLVGFKSAPGLVEHPLRVSTVLMPTNGRKEIRIQAFPMRQVGRALTTTRSQPWM